MIKELNIFRGENVVQGLGKRKLPSNPNSSRILSRTDHLSKNAQAFWERRGYGTFAISIITDETIKTAIGELNLEETQLFSRYLIGKLASDDRQTVRELPKNHPDRKAFAEMLRYEKRRASEIVEDMVHALEKRAGSANAEEAVGLISQELASAADDVKRIFFRKLTKEFKVADRDELITRCVRASATRVSNIRELAASGNQ